MPSGPPTRFPYSMKRLGVLLLPPGWGASPSQGYPPAILTGFPDNSPILVLAWMERATVRVKCFAEERNTVILLTVCQNDSH